MMQFDEGRKTVSKTNHSQITNLIHNINHFKMKFSAVLPLAAAAVIGAAHAAKNPLVHVMSTFSEDYVFRGTKLGGFVAIGDEDACDDEMSELSPPFPLHTFAHM